VKKPREYYEEAIKGWVAKECHQGKKIEGIGGRTKIAMELGANLWEEKNAGEAEGEILLLIETLSRCRDAETILKAAGEKAGAETRIVATTYNTLWKYPREIGAWAGILQKEPEAAWLSKQDVKNLAELALLEVVRQETGIVIPCRQGQWVNKWVAPLIPILGLSTKTIMRKPHAQQAGKISIVIPARNEEGTIKTIPKRIPDLGCETELIFVEGHSTDKTWEEISKLDEKWQRGTITKIQQNGRGKGNAVREGFQRASGDILMILDSDLTTPPEELGKFTEALQNGVCELANGCRLIYPQEKKAMRAANLIANRFFATAFSWVLGQPIKDTLCGTKALWRRDYEQIARNRAHFGSMDPFGDFDLLLGAARLNLKIRDIPVHYKDREYGQTNISRWKHGLILLRMLIKAAGKIKFQ
jgi:hypothetical protein